jgi:hypothetical protein
MEDRPPGSLAFSLSPLFILYLVTGLRLAIALAARARCPGCDTYLAVPEPFAGWLSFEWTALFCLAAVIVVQGARLFPGQAGARLSAFGLAALGLVWVVALYPRLLPSGVTGADPFAYTQMAIDLAARGRPTHHFPLADLALQLNVPIYPTLFVGYTVPHGGDSASVWPPGFSALLAIPYLLFGERSLYLFNPFLGMVSLGLTFILARRLFGLSPVYALAAAAFLLTSLEQTVRLSVPLADIAAQVFTMAAVVAAAGFGRRAPDASVGAAPIHKQMIVCGGLAGLAFVTRYTQLLLIPGLLYALHRQAHPSARSWVRRLPLLFVQSLPFAVSFSLVALPDAAYRALAFGSPLSFAAGELAQFSAADVFPVTLRLLVELASDLGLLVPFVLLGLVIRARTHPAQMLDLAFILGPVILFHLPYHYLKLRDLLFLMPLLCGFAALGVREAFVRWQKAAGQPGLEGARRLAFQLAFAVLFIPLAARLASQWPLLDGYYTYGFLSAEGRMALESVGQRTPSNAAVAASLNAGAINLYARRETFRPGRLLQPGRTWTDGEFVAFVRALQTHGRPVYLLADGEEMDEPIAALDSCCILTRVAELYLPYYHRDGSATNEIIPLYRIDFE